MFFSIKNILSLWILSFTCSCLHGAETLEEDIYPIEYQAYEQEDCIKIKIVLPEETCAKSTVYKINNPNSKGVTAQIKNDSLKCVENFFQLIYIKVNAIPSQGEEGVRFEITELLEQKSPNEEEVTTIIRKKTIFVEIDKQVDFRDVIPKLTFSPNAPHIKYLRFFTMPYLN